MHPPIHSTSTPTHLTGRAATIAVVAFVIGLGVGSMFSRGLRDRQPQRTDAKAMVEPSHRIDDIAVTTQSGE